MACTNYKAGSRYFDLYFQTCASNKGANVEASIMPTEYSGLDSGQNYYWTMYLQRQVGERWTTIGTRTGYVSTTSPSFRTFTNIRTGQRDYMRLFVDFYSNSAKTKFVSNHRVFFYRP